MSTKPTITAYDFPRAPDTTIKPQPSRPHWKDDQAWLRFERNILYADLNFEHIVEFVSMDRWNFSKFVSLKKLKQDWLCLIQTWNNNNNDTLYSATEKTKRRETLGFVGIAMFFAVFPYQTLVNGFIPFTEIEASYINYLCWYVFPYGRKKTRSPFANQVDWSKIYELLQLQQNQLNIQTIFQHHFESCMWWLSYMVYERNHNLPPLFPSPNAKINSNQSQD